MILLYHLVFPDSTARDAWNPGPVLRLSDFKRQCLWLKKHFLPVSLSEYVQGLSQNSKYSFSHFALTFDDGYSQVFELVVPFLIEQKIPATYFVSTGHLETGRLLWFVYINALVSEQVYHSIVINEKTFSLDTPKMRLKAWKILVELSRKSGDSHKFITEFSLNYPLPDYVTRKYSGLSMDQIRKISEIDLLDLGAHTHHHPYLDVLSEANQLQEMLINKELLEDLVGTPVHNFAYTGGIYDKNSLSAVDKAGFQAAFAVTSKRLGSQMKYEIPRVDIYSSSLIKLALKCMFSAIRDL